MADYYELEESALRHRRIEEDDRIRGFRVYRDDDVSAQLSHFLC
jgi:hypothetical protein